MTQLVGILNITPDSFSDGGTLPHLNAVFERAEQMLAEGATILDIGAESTRPNATPLTDEEEWQRLAPILPELLRQLGTRATVSIDSYHASTISRALDLGIGWVNDVSAGADAIIPALLARYPQVRYVVMHHLTIPVNPTITLPETCDPIAEITTWATAKIPQLQQLGINKNQIILDPGIGFGKTATQSMMILARARELHSLNVPILIGHSEKSCFQLFTDAPAGKRGVETALTSAWLAQQGIQYLRVHDVSASARASALQRYFEGAHVQ